MNELTIITQNGGAYIDSREVAELIGKRHDHLLRDINGYLKTLEISNLPKIGGVDFFIKSSYMDTKGETRPCYLITKMGCEMVANKLTGEKGILFTAAYVSKYNEMERGYIAELEAPTAMPAPKLGEINACVRIIVRGLKDLGASPEQIVSFLKETYAPLGINIAIEAKSKIIPRWYKASDIARECGMYSIYGNPHSQAVACIINENLFIGDEHKRVESECYGDYVGVGVYYDEYVLEAVEDWLAQNDYPHKIHSSDRTFHVEYGFE